MPAFELALNDELDLILDKGRDISAITENLEHKSRKDPHYADGSIAAESLLIDYKDNADTFLEYLDITHCVKTLFGHGVYTENRAMLFNINCIIENFYR